MYVHVVIFELCAQILGVCMCFTLCHITTLSCVLRTMLILGPVSANEACSDATCNGSTYAHVSPWCTWYWAAAILWARSCYNSSSGERSLSLLCSACCFRCEAFLLYRDLRVFFGSSHSMLLLCEGAVTSKFQCTTSNVL